MQAVSLPVLTQAANRLSFPFELTAFLEACDQFEVCGLTGYNALNDSSVRG